MAQAVREVFPERLAVQILAVGVDVIVGDLVKRCARRRVSRTPGLMAAMAAFCAPSTIS